MASRTAFPGTATSGSTHLHTEDNSLPGGWIGFVEVTANQGSITTLTDLTGLSQAVTVNSNRKIRVSFNVSRVSSTVTGDAWKFHIREGSTTLATSQSDIAGATIASGGGAMFWTGNPSSGSHTYKMSLERTAGTGTITMAASATEPAQLLIEDIGPSS